MKKSTYVTSFKGKKNRLFLEVERCCRSIHNNLQVPLDLATVTMTKLLLAVLQYFHLNWKRSFVIYWITYLQFCRQAYCEKRHQVFLFVLLAYEHFCWISQNSHFSIYGPTNHKYSDENNKGAAVISKDLEFYAQ